MIINTKIPSVNFNLKRDNQQTKPSLNSLKADTVSFKAYGPYTKQAPIINGDSIIFPMASDCEIAESEINRYLTDKDLKFDSYAKVAVEKDNRSRLLEINLRSLKMGENSRLYLSDSLKLNVANNAVIGNDCVIVADQKDKMVFTYLSGQTNTIGNNFKTVLLSQSNGKLTIGDGFDGYNILSKSGDISIGKNAKATNIVNANGTVKIGATEDIKRIDTAKLVCTGNVSAHNVNIRDSVETQNNATLHVLEDLVIYQSEKPREVTIKNAVIDEDLIIYKDSNVTKLNLENVTIKGAIVSENKLLKLSADTNSTFKEFLSPKY